RSGAWRRANSSLPAALLVRAVSWARNSAARAAAPSTIGVYARQGAALACPAALALEVLVDAPLSLARALLAVAASDGATSSSGRSRRSSQPARADSGRACCPSALTGAELSRRASRRTSPVATSGPPLQIPVSRRLARTLSL